MAAKIAFFANIESKQSLKEIHRMLIGTLDTHSEPFDLLMFAQFVACSKQRWHDDDVYAE